VVGGNGLANLTARAEGLGGTCSAHRGDAGGSVVEWRVPAAQPER
jgi:signal transduction histidine kinase